MLSRAVPLPCPPTPEPSSAMPATPSYIGAACPLPSPPLAQCCRPHHHRPRPTPFKLHSASLPLVFSPRESLGIPVPSPSFSSPSHLAQLGRPPRVNHCSGRPREPHPPPSAPCHVPQLGKQKPLNDFGLPQPERRITVVFPIPSRKPPPTSPSLLRRVPHQFFPLGASPSLPLSFPTTHSGSPSPQRCLHMSSVAPPQIAVASPTQPPSVPSDHTGKFHLLH